MSINMFTIGRKILMFSLTVTLILIWVLPMYYVWSIELEESQGEWFSIYLIFDRELRVFVLPLYIFFPMAMLLKKSFLRRLMKVMLLLNALFLFWLGAAMGVSAQDYAMGLGAFAMFTVFPQLVALFYLDWILKHRKSKSPEN